MRKLVILNVALLILYLLLSFGFSEWRADYLDVTFYGEFQNFSVSESFDVVNTGTSHGSVSFDWKITKNLNGLNLARSSQSFQQDLFLLNNYKDDVFNAIIIVPVSFHSFCFTDYDYNPILKLFGNQLPFFGISQTAASIDLLINSEIDRPFPNDEFINEDFFVNKLKPSKCNATIVNRNLNYLIEIISTYDVVLITTPYYYEYLDDLIFFREFYDILNNLVTDYEIKYYDYSRDARFMNKSYFFDPSHLNQEGRIKFTEIVIEEILLNYN